MKKSKGFTLIELVIVIVIIGILAIIAVPLYRGYTRRAMAAEANAMLGAIATSQKTYYAEHNSFLGLDGAQTTENSKLGVNPITNKYFASFTLTSNGVGTDASFGATASGAGDALKIDATINGTSTAPAAYSVTGL